jgi:hypothetical protein
MRLQERARADCAGDKSSRDNQLASPQRGPAGTTPRSAPGVRARIVGLTHAAHRRDRWSDGRPTIRRSARFGRGKLQQSCIVTAGASGSRALSSPITAATRSLRRLAAPSATNVAAVFTSSAANKELRAARRTFLHRRRAASAPARANASEDAPRSTTHRLAPHRIDSLTHHSPRSTFASPHAFALAAFINARARRLS